MNLDRYIGRNLIITLTNGYFYKGLVIDASEDSLTLKDVTGKEVFLKLPAILTLREVEL